MIEGEPSGIINPQSLNSSQIKHLYRSFARTPEVRASFHFGKVSFDLSKALGDFASTTNFAEKLSIYRDIKFAYKHAKHLRIYQASDHISSSTILSKGLIVNTTDLKESQLRQLLKRYSEQPSISTIVDANSGEEVVNASYITLLKKLGYSKKRVLNYLTSKLKSAKKVKFFLHSVETANTTSINQNLTEQNPYKKKRSIVLKGGLDEDTALALITEQSKYSDRVVSIVRQYKFKPYTTIYPSHMLTIPSGLNPNAVEALKDSNKEDVVISITIEEGSLYTDVPQRQY